MAGHYIPEAPEKLKIRAGLYETKGPDDLVYSIKKSEIYGDWDVRNRSGSLFAREESLKDAMFEISRIPVD